MHTFQWKPIKKELHIPISRPYGMTDVIVFEFKYDPHSRKWRIGSPSIPHLRPTNRSKAKGDTIVDFLNSINKIQKIIEDLLDKIEKTKYTPLFFDTDQWRWRIKCIYDKSLTNYSNEYFDYLMSGQIERESGKVEPFLVTTKLSIKTKKSR